MKVVMALVLVAVAACGKKAAPPVPAGTAAVSGPVRLRGRLLVRDSSFFVVACGTSVERAVTMGPASQLEEALFAVTGGVRDAMSMAPIADTTGARRDSMSVPVVADTMGGVRDSMYVEVMADTIGDRLKVRETLFATSVAEAPDCTRLRFPYSVEAVGTEPFWRVTLDSTQLVLERSENPLELTFVADAPMGRGAVTLITGHRDEGQVREIRVGLLRAPCRDGMSDAWYPYSTEVRIGFAVLRGCARR